MRKPEKRRRCPNQEDFRSAELEGREMEEKIVHAVLKKRKEARLMGEGG